MSNFIRGLIFSYSEMSFNKLLNVLEFDDSMVIIVIHSLVNQ